VKRVKILIVQPHGIGDQVMITPLLKLIKDNYKNSVVRVVVSSAPSQSVISKSELADEIQVFDRRKAGILDYFRLLWRNFIFAPDVFYVAPYTNLFFGQMLSFASNAKIRIGEDKTIPLVGFTHYNSECRNMHKVDANIFLFNMGLELLGESPGTYFHLEGEELLYGELFFTEKKLNDCVVLGVHVGCDGNSKYRRYPLDKFQNIIDSFLALNDSHRVICFFGPDESYLFNLLKRHPSVFVVKEEPIQYVASIIKNLDVMLTTDSGLGHISTAFDVPCISIMGPANSLVTSPYGNMHAVVETNKKLACKPCIHTKEYVNCSHFDCLNTIDESAILSKILEKI